ncbi:DSBA oxidoreductase [Magnetococcus marinus MC-1]|uniref:Thiol:disulfide interchange protein n=1 Tax=Magnetococcus marinus (strain ATCC BAA-1437 / JCM 17883 / MC-1) TaxID=156889 RepID=A0L506_MAGMM|nr:thiol:disulfide interchange protein DsbA/DsbL [Magnetococcus marinus]ABK43049.1 DSBA oxidoreductase [Magnetococcus marinus MC-1]
MRFYLRLWLAFAITLGLASPVQAGDNEKLYHLINPPVALQGEAPEVVEVFNFHCPHCNDFYPVLEKWAHGYQGKLNVHSLPVYWGSQPDTPVRAYFAAEYLGVGEKMKRAIFAANFDDNRYKIDEEQDILKIASEAGIDAKKLEEAMDSFAVFGKVAQVNSLARQYGIQGTPSVVVNGRYRVVAHGDYGDVVKTIESLLQK